MKETKFKEDILEDYSKNEPQLLIKYEGHGYENVSVKKKHEVCLSITPELLNVEDVAILINPDNVEKKDVLFLISAITRCIKKDNKIFEKAKIASEEYWSLCCDKEELETRTDDILAEINSFEELESVSKRVEQMIRTEREKEQRKCLDPTFFNEQQF